MDITRKRLIPAAIVAGILLAAGLWIGLSWRNSGPTGSKLVVGWQPPWANQGQIVAIMKHSDLLSARNLDVEFVPFTYGAPMVEAALANRVDVVFAGEQPVLNLLSKSPQWCAVARMVQYRSAVIVPPDSPLKSLADLAGMKVATAVGSTTHRDFVRRLTEEGVKGVEILNVDQGEHASLTQRSSDGKWGAISAIATYDPTIALVISHGHGRILSAWASPGLVAVRREKITNSSDQVRAFLAAYRESFVRYGSDPSSANKWYAEESRLPLTDDDYRMIAEFEPNLKAGRPEDVQIALTDAVIATAKANANVAKDLGIMKELPNFDTQFVRDLTTK